MMDLGKANNVISMEFFWVDSKTSRVGEESNTWAYCHLPVIEHLFNTLAIDLCGVCVPQSSFQV